MSTIQSFIAKHPGYALSSQYAPVADGMNSVIGFFNYFDQVFRGSGTGVTLHMFFFDRQGRQTAARRIEVPPNEAVQYDARQDGIESDGLVAMAAVPQRDIHEINQGRVQIKPQVNTGFYIKWENATGGRDLMHEWTTIQAKPLPRARHHAGFMRAACEIEHGVVLMNPVAAAGAVSVPRLVLRESGHPKPMATATLDPIPPLGTQVTRLSSVFTEFAGALAAGRSLVVDVEAENLSGPLTADWHRQGDFHLHHL